MHLHPERIAQADRDAAAVVMFVRARGYFDVHRDRMRFDGQSPPPDIPPNSSGSGGAGVSVSKITYPSLPDRTVVSEFNGEHVVGRTWPTADNAVAVLELTY